EGDEIPIEFQDTFPLGEHKHTVIIGDIVFGQEAVPAEMPVRGYGMWSEESETEVEQLPVRKYNDIFRGDPLLHGSPKGLVKPIGGPRDPVQTIFQMAQHLDLFTDRTKVQSP